MTWRLFLLLPAAIAACAAPEAPSPRGTVALGVPPAAEAAPTLAARPRLASSRGLPVAESDPRGAELAFVTAILRDLNPRSIRANRELCGYIGLDRRGELVATPVSAGSEASCPLPPVPRGMTLLASFHTHGTYSPYYASEWPTTQDLLTDAADGIDGYIATPGGRLWHADSDTLTVRLLCGRGCLPQDPAYVAAEDGPLRPLMSLAYLAAWERG